ncbi:ABC transporter permease [Actinomadura opuntiae]|uniref:ABC transporter permease n=1 Tax=Actinomadura sp. OS1-43 TaxID=604315 RepID=UPI00255B32C8|nr:ABC transporter permease [Actinomadura sp. OS1-43]MDL4817400.1 ABC transporter permease [Actinomadura sp. OS1-43]
MDHARHRTAREHWTAFRESPFLPAVVLLLILGAAAGLFAGSYCYAMANPAPRHVPVAVTGHGESAQLVRALDAGLDTSLSVRRYATDRAARHAVEEQRAFAILLLQGDRAQLDVAAAAGASVSRLLTQAAPIAGRTSGVPLTVRDIKPLQPTDPQGLAIFYISLASVIIGFVGAIQLSVHARALNAGERIFFTAAYAVLGGFAICAVVDWLLGVLDLPFRESWGICALTMFTSGMVFTMFNTLVGRWAMIPTWGLMVLIGNPSSGGAVSWPLLPSPLGLIGRWLPPGASVNAQHTAIYFHGHQHVLPFVTLAAWTLLATAVFLVWRHRHPGGRETAHAHAR